MLNTLALALSTFAPAHMSDADFLKKYAAGNMGEIAISRYMWSQTQDPGIKAACSHMVHDHGAALAMIKKIAKKQHINVPNEMSDGDRQYLSELKTHYGADLNRNFVAHMTQGHANALDDFRMESKMGRNHMVKKFAADTIPTLQMHAMMWNKLG